MNIAQLISDQALQTPDNTATVMPIKKFLSRGFEYQRLTFLKLDKLIENYAYHLSQMGFRPGDRTLLFLKPCLEFHALVFALFRAGVVPVMIDPGMGKKNLLRAIEHTLPRGLIGESLVFLIKKFYPNSFNSIELQVSKSELKRWSKSEFSFPLVQRKETDLAAILFTSGGTGTPKGVEYTHQILVEQTRLLKEMFQLTSKERDLAGFPLFSLFTLAMGMQSCIAAMNPSKPASCNPKKLIQNILDTKASFLAGSPAIWERVADYCLKNQITLPSVKFVVMFGAPVRIELHQKFQKILPNGTTYTPYGATEALPVSCLSGREILEKHAAQTQQGLGTCIGKAVPGVEIKIIPTCDQAIANLSEVGKLSAFERGEIIVKGKTVTRRYFAAEEATIKAKIQDGDEFWHRMGDLGHLDQYGNLWFCGRKDHRVETKNEVLYSVNCEAIFNQHPLVKRTALIAQGERSSQRPGLAIETKRQISKRERDVLCHELLNLGVKYAHTKTIRDFYFVKKFPVDVRHNIKIDRLKLKQLAEENKL